MPMQIVNTVNKRALVVLNERLMRLIFKAKYCDSNSSVSQIRESQKALYEARELFHTLRLLRALEADISVYDIDLTESKIESIISEKLRERKGGIHSGRKN